jgi:hypothetical protein
MTNRRYRTFDGDGHSILVICGQLSEFPSLLRWQADASRCNDINLFQLRSLQSRHHGFR